MFPSDPVKRFDANVKKVPHKKLPFFFFGVSGRSPEPIAPARVRNRLHSLLKKNI